MIFKPAAYWEYKFVPSFATGITVNLNATNATSYPGTGTTWNDLSGNGYNATVTGFTYNAGPPANLAFNGTTGFGNITNSASYGSATGNFTWGGWFRWGTAGTVKEFVTRGRDGSGNGWSLKITTNANNTITASNVTTSPSTAQLDCTSPGTYNVNTWYQIYGVWTNGTSLKLYINGSLIQTVTTTRTSLRTSTVFWDIARANSTYGNCLSSTVNIYLRALTDFEISNNFDVQKSTYGY